jgi:hypothetical protein
MGQQDRRLRPVEFTYDWYREFLDRLQAAGYDFRTFADDPGPGEIFLRHDVDLSVESAINMARIEADYDVEATYCILVTSALYNPLDSRWRDTIRAIEVLGHDVALHFSTHEYWGGIDRPDEETVSHRVRAEQSVLGTITSGTPETVSFHVPPDWVLGRSFEGFRSTYAPTYFSDIGYVADSGQRWRRQPPTIEDLPETVQVLTHPGLWGERDDPFESCVAQAVSDACSHTDEKARREFFDGVGR